jgi:hypothetical protein
MPGRINGADESTMRPKAGVRRWRLSAMKDRTALATICLRISSAIYAIAGLAFLGHTLSRSRSASLPTEVSLIGCTLCLTFAAGIEVVARGLRGRRYWGWVAALCIFTLYTPSIFLPLGVLGLWALLTPATRARFGVGPLTSVTKRPQSSTTARVAIRLILLAIALTGCAIAHGHLSGVGMPPYSSVPDPSEQERIHRLVGLALFTVATLSALVAATFVAVILVRHRQRTG